ncbi:hypothetical protein GCM10027275_55710 [Rhabdobacter roseus]
MHNPVENFRRVWIDAKILWESVFIKANGCGQKSGRISKVEREGLSPDLTACEYTVESVHK